MSRDELIDDEPFSYQSTRNGLVQIAYNGRIVTTLSSREGARFISRVTSGDNAHAQLVMAKATGHFKHGTERTSRNRRGKT